MRGPLPSYRPEFPPTFLEQAATSAGQRTVAYQLRQRATLVLLLHSQPLVSNGEAAQRVQLHLCSVQRWRRRWAQGDFALEDQPGRGRGVRCEQVGLALAVFPHLNLDLASIGFSCRPGLARRRNAP